jgi:hypothetical protein
VPSFSRGLLLSIAIVAAQPVTATSPATRGVPILIELFTSEGCSSCPPADALLQRMIESQPAAGAEIIGLAEHVDYWDRQGWKDRFSSAALTNRQQVYGAHFNNDSIYTPQMVVDGRAEFVGSDGEAARRAIQRAAAFPHGKLDIVVDATAAAAVQIQRSGSAKRAALQISVTATDLPVVSRGDHADLIVAVTENHLQSDVSRGENRGRVLKHAAVVRQLQLAGEVPAGPHATIAAELPIDPAWQEDQLKIVAFVQERRGRAILASAAIPVRPR